MAERSERRSEPVAVREPAAVDDPVIVVGAGSAGAVVAARLAAAAVPVLLLEAGPDHDAAATPPAIAGANFFAACTDAFLWPGLDGRRTPSQAPRRYLRGRVVGGCSAVNAMVGLWATPADHDAPGWPASLGWAATAARRAAIERRLPLWRPPLAAWSPVEQALAVAAQGAGHRWCDDHHAAGAAGIGIGPAPLTVRDGRRVSVNEGYLEPMRSPGYLTVRGGAEVAAVLLDGRRARGVRLTDGTELAARRVVVAAGAINSPVLLLRSGVSAAGVGEGLGDHPSAPVTLVLRPTGRLQHPDRYVVNSLLRYSSGLVAGDDGVADMQVLTIAAVGAGPQDLGVAVAQAAVMRSFSRGRVTIDAAGAPVLDFRLLDDERDRLRLRDGVRRLVGLCRHPAMTAVTEAVVLNGLDGSAGVGGLTGGDIDALLADDGALDGWLAANTGDYVHACGTCRMGEAGAPGAVVDPSDGAVHGYEALHVIDASVLPDVPRANTHLTTVLVAEVLADGLLSRCS